MEEVYKLLPPVTLSKAVGLPSRHQALGKRPDRNPCFRGRKKYQVTSTALHRLFLSFGGIACGPAQIAPPRHQLAPRSRTCVAT